MFSWLENLLSKVKNLNSVVNQYKEDTVIQSLPSFAHVNKAKKLIEKNDLKEAKKVLIKALEFPNKDALVYKYLGIIYDKEKKFDKAVAAYQISADWNPHDKNIWQKLGFALIQINKYEEAVKSFDNANRISANNTDTFTGWGMALMKQQKYDEAREKFSKASALNRYNFSAIFLNAVMDIKLKEYSKAEMKLTFLANVCPNETNTYEFAHLKFLKGEYESAKHYAIKSLDYNPNMLPSYLLIAKVYALSFDEDNALSYFQMAENRELIAASLYHEWGLVLEKFERYEEAKLKFLKAFEMDNEKIETIAHLGLCNVALKNFDEAEPILQKVLESEPENKIVKQALGIVSYENKNFEQAVKCFKESFDEDEDDSISFYYLAKCYEAMNNDSKVKDSYETAILKNPKYISAYVDYAKYLITCENYAEAQRKLRKALKIEPENVEILNLLFFTSYMLVKENVCEYNIKETVAIAQKIEGINPDLFEYPDKKNELSEILKEKSEREQN